MLIKKFFFKKILPVGTRVFCFLILGSGFIFAEMTESPANLVAALIVKLGIFEKNISGKPGDITIYVMGAPGVSKELKRGIGKNIGKAILKHVVEGDSLPKTKPNILYVEDISMVEVAIQYTRTNKVLSTTRIPNLVTKGVTLGIGVGDDGKPKVLLNLSASVAEGLDWNPAIMKIARTYK